VCKYRAKRGANRIIWVGQPIGTAFASPLDVSRYVARGYVKRGPPASS